MALSEFEKRVLAEIEDGLERDTPGLAAKLGGSCPSHHRPPRRSSARTGLSRAALGAVLMIIGVIAGASGPYIVVLAGYVILVLGLCTALSGWFWRHYRGDP